MAHEIHLQNIKDGFSEVRRARDLVGRTLMDKPDMAVFMEAYAERAPEPVQDVVEQFEQHGYMVKHGLYADEDARVDRHGMMTIIRKELVSGAVPPALIRLGGRTAIKATIEPEDSDPFDVFAVHFDDRSEVSRLAMVEDIADHTELDVSGRFVRPTVVVSSIVGIPRDNLLNRPLRAIRPVVGLLPQADPNPVDLPPRWPYRFGLARRLSDMAIGAAYERLEAYGVTSSDAYGVPTMPSIRPLIQLDQIFVTPDFDVKWYEISKHVASADHGLYTPAATHRRYAASLELQNRSAALSAA